MESVSVSLGAVVFDGKPWCILDSVGVGWRVLEFDEVQQC